MSSLDDSSLSLPPKIRAFIAIRVSEEVEAAIADFIEEIRSPDDGIAWSRRDRLHVTLKFLGPAIDSAKIAPLIESIGRLTNGMAAFVVRTHGVGGFPDLRRPRVLWAGLESDVLVRLAAQIEDAATAVGFDRSEQSWAPHLTIARVRDPRKLKRVLRHLEAAKDRDFGQSTIDEVTLYRSQMSSNGSTHEPLARFRLRPS